jgi:hypothetical protein
VKRFSSIQKAISECGLCSAEKSSVDAIQRKLPSKQRNMQLQYMIETAKTAPRNTLVLVMIYDREKQTENANRVRLAVARMHVGYPVAVDRRQTDFLERGNKARTAARRAAIRLVPRPQNSHRITNKKLGAPYYRAFDQLIETWFWYRDLSAIFISRFWCAVKSRSCSESCMFAARMVR